jgi:hypothetical protein
MLNPFILSAVLAANASRLTLHSFLVDIPHDPAAFVIYALSLGAIVWVVKAGLKKPDSDESGEE